jgi:CheY-specific phosphatase CheX
MANTAWGELSWSAGTFGGANDVDVLITGQSLISALNDVSISLSPNVSLTGEQLSTSLNSVSFSIDGNVALTTNLANLTLNSVSAFPIILVPVTAPGTPTTWGADSWGSGSWGENIGLSLSQGTATVDVITPANVTGQLLSTSLNSVTLTIDGSVALTGQLLNAQLSSVGISADGNVSIPVFENPLSLALGTVDPAPDANVTGQQLTLSFNGTVDIDIAVAAVVTGQNLTLALGNETVDLNTPVNVTGQSLTLVLNSISTKIDVSINVTGFGLTGTTGQLYVGAWAPVNTGQSIVWTEVAA